MARSQRLAFAFCLALTGALAVVGGTAAEPREIESKRTQAEVILAQLQAMDMELDRAVDAWNGANVRLQQIEQELAANTRRLRVARASLARAQDRAALRLLELYTSDEPDAVDVILGSESLSELVDRLDDADRVAAEDARLAAEVRRYKAEVAGRQRELERARAEQRKVVAERAARRAAIEQQLQDRQALYESIKDQIAQLEAEERARQARLAREARARAAALERRREQAEEQPSSQAAPESQPAPQ